MHTSPAENVAIGACSTNGSQVRLHDLWRFPFEKWCFQENKKGYLKKNFDSKLGQELYGKKVGESFSILGNQGTIVSIDI